MLIRKRALSQLSRVTYDISLEDLHKQKTEDQNHFPEKLKLFSFQYTTIFITKIVGIWLSFG